MGIQCYDGTACTRLGPGKVSVLFRLDNVLWALVGEYQGRQARVVAAPARRGPVRTQLTLHIAGLTALRCAAERGETRDPYAAGAHHWLLGPGRRPVLPLRGNPPEAPPRRAA